MCGFAGFITKKDFKLESVAKNMSDSIAHRGPDDEDIWIKKDLGLAISFRRLSIIDLSLNGRQPMVSYDNRYVIAFNGEIYNFKLISKKLVETAKNENLKFTPQGTSDTEILVNSFAIFGIEKTLSLIIGQFAIVLWDNFEKKIHLIRDRMGEKPLYYGFVNGSFTFSSEIKALKKFPNFSNKICKDNLGLFFKYLSIPSPYSIYEKIYKIEPGSILSINYDSIFSIEDNFDPSANQNNKYTYKKFWSLIDVAKKSYNNQINSIPEVLNSLENVLLQSINSQSYADVKLGVFLSGGIDSTLIASLMQSQFNTPINTYSVGFDNPKYNEANYAKKIATNLKTNHNEIYVDSKDALQVVENLSSIYCEPFADSSQIPTYLLCKNVKKITSVALSGDGGDELFGGYNRYFWIKNLWNKISLFPPVLRKIIGNLILRINSTNIDKICNLLFFIVSNKNKINFVGQKIHRFAERLIKIESIDSLYFTMIAEWHELNEVLKSPSIPKIFLDDPEYNTFNEIENRMMLNDSLLYLPEDILVKTDRASMSNSLEVRCPYLDANVVDFSWRIPLNMKIKNQSGKWILKEMLKKFLPETLFNRPKQGFAAPISDWLNGPLKDWSENLLSEKSLNETGFLNTEIIRKKWKEHTSLKKNWDQSLWTILIFQNWCMDNRL